MDFSILAVHLDSTLLLVTAASFLAGLIDAIVGGGGLILVPALFAFYPTAAPATLLGTNKSASICGTAWATLRYAKRVHLRWHSFAPAVLTALVGAFLGAWLVTLVDGTLLRKALPALLCALLLYTLYHKNLGRAHTPHCTPQQERLRAMVMAFVIGVYDGFFGPGTGSFFIFFMVQFLGFDFLNASAHAKLLNAATNLAAIVLFAYTGHIWWHMVLFLAVGNVLGSLVGTRLALQHGAGFVRIMFLCVTSALIAKTAWDAWG